MIPKLIGEDSREQMNIDFLLREIDGTSDFGMIGANVAVSLSLANAKAAASSIGMELFSYLGGAFVQTTPLPLGNVIGGGAHAANATEIQEFLVVPVGASGAHEAVFTNALVHRKVRELLLNRDQPCGKGDEGAWAPSISDEVAFEVVKEATGAVSDETGIRIGMGIDVAASGLWQEGDSRYHYREKVLTSEDQIAYISELVDRYELMYVEDPLHEEDFTGICRPYRASR